MDSSNHLKSMLFSLLNANVQICLEPNECCQGKPIKAHSIQNAGILEQLSLDGHVIMPKVQYKRKGEEVSVKFQEIGVNNATTFTGLCRKHDNHIFEKIEKNSINLSNAQHLFLLVYRAVLKELHATICGAYRVQAMYNERVKFNSSMGEVSDEITLYSLSHTYKVENIYLYKRKFDNILLTQRYSDVTHDLFSFEHRIPSISVCSLFSMDEIFIRNYVALVSLNVFPLNGITHVIFSCLREDKPYIHKKLDKILLASGARKLNLLSKLILESCENIVFSPAYFNEIENSKKEMMSKYFDETIYRNKPFDNLDDLCLFAPKKTDV